MMKPAVKLFVGNDNPTCQGRRLTLTGPRMFNGTYGPLSRFTPDEVPHVDGWADSGAFQEPEDKRVSFDTALERQLAWECRASSKWGAMYRHTGIVSYDLLIDEKWVGGKKRKERWDIAEADKAVRVTVDAASYLASQRQRIAPRVPVLACQGVDATQYAECAAGVLEHAKPGDVFGLGGWCILGLRREWLGAFWRTCRRVLPMVAAAGITRVHVFGVMWQVPLGGLVWLADRHGLAVSTDSKKPISDCNWKTPEQRKQAGARRDRWEDNVAWWQDRLANLRDTDVYCEPPTDRKESVQLTMF